MIPGSSLLSLPHGSALGEIALLADVRDSKVICLTKNCIDLIVFSYKKLNLVGDFKPSCCGSYVPALKNIKASHIYLIGNEGLKLNQKNFRHVRGVDDGLDTFLSSQTKKILLSLKALMLITYLLEHYQR